MSLIIQASTRFTMNLHDRKARQINISSHWVLFCKFIGTGDGVIIMSLLNFWGARHLSFTSYSLLYVIQVCLLNYFMWPYFIAQLILNYFHFHWIMKYFHIATFFGFSWSWTLNYLKVSFSMLLMFSNTFLLESSTFVSLDKSMCCAVIYFWLNLKRL